MQRNVNAGMGKSGRRLGGRKVCTYPLSPRMTIFSSFGRDVCIVPVAYGAARRDCGTQRVSPGLRQVSPPHGPHKVLKCMQQGCGRCKQK